MGALVRAALPLAMLAPLLIGSGGLRSDDLACEERVVQLADCCPSLEPWALDCEYNEGCDGAAYPPVILPDESECIAALDCEAIRAARICERLEARQVLLDAQEIESSLEGAREAPLCP